MNRWAPPLFALCILLSGCGVPSQAADNKQQTSGELQLKLPKGLREISGLALAADGALLAVADERSHVYRIDVVAHTVNKHTKFGDPAARGDFEGIAVHNERLYLVTSDGEIWVKRLDTPPTEYQRYNTGIGARCEVEGLAAWPTQDLLLVLCKEARDKSLKGQLVVFSWQTARPAEPASVMLGVDLEQAGLPKLHPSGITFTADGQRLFIVAARQRYFVEMTLDGEVVRAGSLPHPDTHPQTEGVVITTGNTLYLADEGDKKRGTVTRYEPTF